MYYSIINLVKFLIVPTYKKHTKIIIRILQFRLDIDSMNLKKDNLQHEIECDNCHINHLDTVHKNSGKGKHS